MATQENSFPGWSVRVMWRGTRSWGDWDAYSGVLHDRKVWMKNARIARQTWEGEGKKAGGKWDND